jgi:hypothetical protein
MAKKRIAIPAGKKPIIEGDATGQRVVGFVDIATGKIERFDEQRRAAVVSKKEQKAD